MGAHNFGQVPGRQVAVLAVRIKCTIPEEWARVDAKKLTQK